MIITPTMKMADVIIQNHHLLSIINRFGIQLGFGEKSVKSVCELHDISTEFFLEIVNIFNDPDYFPHKNLEGYPLTLIIEYLYKTHHYYLNIKIPEIKEMIEKLKKSSIGETAKSVMLIQKFFDEYAEQLLTHIVFEEENVYPYILKLEGKFNLFEKKGKIDNTDKFDFKHYASHHNDIEEKLFDIKNLIIKYISPKENFAICFKILGQLAHLEEDIIDHSEIENKILIPRVLNMENKLSENIKV